MKDVLKLDCWSRVFEKIKMLVAAENFTIAIFLYRQYFIHTVFTIIRIIHYPDMATFVGPTMKLQIMFAVAIAVLLTCIAIVGYLIYCFKSSKAQSEMESTIEVIPKSSDKKDKDESKKEPEDVMKHETLDASTDLP